MDAKQVGPSKARRRVIQGSLAAPVVLTVSSASAASVSSFGRCLKNVDDRAAGPFFIDPKRATDNWLRKEVPVVQLSKGNHVDWFYMDPGRRLLVRLADPDGPGLNPWDMEGWQLRAKSSRLALVWVDAKDGDPYRVMQVMRPSGYKASTKSCYTSLLKG